jgi:hypothetical protein
LAGLLAFDWRLLIVVWSGPDWLLNTVRKSAALAVAALLAGKSDLDRAGGGVNVVCNVVLNVGMT